MQVSHAQSTGATLPAVMTSQTLAGYTVAGFDEQEQSKFVDVVETNLYNMYGPVNFVITGITSGSVVLDTTTTFLTGRSDYASSYVQTLQSGTTSSVYGSYAVSVNTGNVTQSSVENPQAGRSCD
ncbi:TPA: hypothetical protein ACH3X2_012816 [Trebouxia sp. C0005]